MTMSSAAQGSEDTITEYVTAMIGGQLFGLPISRVQDVFIPERMTRVPLASSCVAGVLNLRGRIVTAVDMRSRLGLPKNDSGRPRMAIGVDLRGEFSKVSTSRSAKLKTVSRRSNNAVVHCPTRCCSTGTCP